MSESTNEVTWPASLPWPWNVLSTWFTVPGLAPRVLTQPILPGWIFANMVNVTDENSSSPETERQIVSAHSYGQQLGWITDVLHDMIGKWGGAELDHDAAGKVEALWHQAGQIKQQSAAQRADRVLADLGALKKQDPEKYAEVVRKVRAMLGDS